jgi:transposase-like protein
MVTRVVTCPDCQSEQIIRFGHTKGGHDRYRCKACGRTFFTPWFV